MPRFAILFHQTPPGYIRQNHYDLLFEHGESLRAWAVSELPSDNPDQPAERLPDHRPLYLEYEGPISNGRGSVTRVDTGLFEIVEQTPTRWVVNVRGKRCLGLLTFENAEDLWRVSFQAAKL